MSRPATKIRIIACQTVGEELQSLLPADIALTQLEFNLHRTPENLHIAIQKEIDATADHFDTILLGYGLCANAVIGLQSRRFQLVIPKVDDCIALFLGSQEEYIRQLKYAPGTYYLTKGWIECGDDPYTEYCAMRGKYGHDKAYRVTRRYIANYTRLALINTGNYHAEAYRKYARMVADYFNLTYEEIPGSNALLQKMIKGQWDQDFVLVTPEAEVLNDMFYHDKGRT